MTEEMESAILEACIQAVLALGDSYKGMSCFLKNWESTEDQEEMPLAA